MSAREFHRFNCEKCGKETPFWFDHSWGWRCVRCDPPPPQPGYELNGVRIGCMPPMTAIFVELEPAGYSAPSMTQVTNGAI